MPKRLTLKKGLSSILFWSIISAAFIGPGTVFTASKAGASYGLSLLWALLFSTIATIFLQEAAARVTIASGQSLGQILAQKYGGRSALKWFIFGAVAFGCAAYQAGNILGGVKGLDLVLAGYSQGFTVLIAALAAFLLWLGNYRLLTQILGLVVAFMGATFIYAAFQKDWTLGEGLQSAFIPSMPEGSSLLIVGLIGTTIVPYNLFLASGISKGQDIQEMRWGIAIAVLLGGLISMAILIVGIPDFTAEGISRALGLSNKWATALCGFGLFAAGMTSSVTAPLAAAVTAQSLFGNTKNNNWANTSKKFRLVWGAILFIGLGFGLSGIKPIPAIILAQAINGFLLPIVVVFLLLVVNDETLLPKDYLNNTFSNLILLLLVGLSSFLGFQNVLKASSTGIGQVIDPFLLISVSSLLALVLTLILTWEIFKK